MFYNNVFLFFTKCYRRKEYILMKTVNKKPKNEFLPKGWQRLKLKDVYDISAGGDFNSKESSQIQNKKYIYPIYSNALTNRGLYGYSTYAKHDADAITITGRGDIGIANHRTTEFVAIGRLLVLQNKIPILNKFVSEYINYKVRFLKETTGVPQLTVPQVGAYHIIFPSFFEQKRIVEVLATWDQAIEKLEKLISAKQKQFKWFLKTLITDQQDNPSWKKIKLETVLDYEQPTKYIVHSTKYDDQHSTPVLTAGKTFVIGYTNEKGGIFPMSKLPVIIFDDFTTSKQFVDFPFKVKSSAMKILLSKKENTDIKFIFYSMINIKFQIKSHKRFWISQYSKIKIPLPSFSEQERIIKMLSKYEKEIEILKKLSEKYKEQKKGLMQKLLTGKIRL